MANINGNEILKKIKADRAKMPNNSGMITDNKGRILSSVHGSCYSVLISIKLMVNHC